MPALQGKQRPALEGGPYTLPRLNANDGDFDGAEEHRLKPVPLVLASARRERRNTAPPQRSGDWKKGVLRWWL